MAVALSVSSVSSSWPLNTNQRACAVTKRDAWNNRSEVEISDLRVPVLGRQQLLANKRATGRPKDLADASWLEEKPPP